MRGRIYGGYTIPVPSANADEYARWRNQDLEGMDADQLRCELAEVLKAINAIKSGQLIRRSHTLDGKAPGPALGAYVTMSGTEAKWPITWLEERRTALEAHIQGVPPWQPGSD